MFPVSVFKTFHFISFERANEDINLVVLVAILPAYFCILSNSSFSYWVQLSQRTCPYSSNGLIYENLNATKRPFGHFEVSVVKTVQKKEKHIICIFK